MSSDGSTAAKTQVATSSQSNSTRLTSLTALDSPWPCRSEVDPEFAEGSGWTAELRMLGGQLPRPSSTGMLHHHELLQKTANPTEGEISQRIEALRRNIRAVEAERDEAKAEAEMIRREADMLEHKKADLTGRLASRGIPWDVEARLKHQELGNARLAVAYSVQVQRMEDELAHATEERSSLDDRLAALLMSVQESREQQALADVDLKQKVECEANARQVTEIALFLGSTETTATTDSIGSTKKR